MIQQIYYNVKYEDYTNRTVLFASSGRLGSFGTESVSPCATVYGSFFILKVVLTV
ncbi:MAG: hypothetical protein WC312_05170 [Candidatus Omnitrophota bacterium]